jgi:hypothetical protein
MMAWSMRSQFSLPGTYPKRAWRFCVPAVGVTAAAAAALRPAPRSNARVIDLKSLFVCGRFGFPWMSCLGQNEYGGSFLPFAVNVVGELGLEGGVR